MAHPTKNKTKFWRKNAIKGYGRKLKQQLAGFNHPAWPTPTLLKMFKKAGIATPILDRQREVHKNDNINLVEGNTSEA